LEKSNNFKGQSYPDERLDRAIQYILGSIGEM